MLVIDIKVYPNNLRHQQSNINFCKIETSRYLHQIRDLTAEEYTILRCHCSLIIIQGLGITMLYLKYVYSVVVIAKKQAVSILLRRTNRNENKQ